MAFDEDNLPIGDHQGGIDDRSPAFVGPFYFPGVPVQNENALAGD
jgi:hypothetical protein